ncbi:MAG: MarR family winged helix-turn-helix transcriptional regulator [Ekhidna sp.]
MAGSFDPSFQEKDLTSKVVVGLERLSEVFRVMLWEKSKATGLSPIQIQLLLFLHHHNDSLANVSHLSKEFNLKKPTISDAIKSLYQKELITKETGEDARAYTIHLTKNGKKILKTLVDYDMPLRESVESLSTDETGMLYQSMVVMIHHLNQSGIIQVQRTCLGCQFYKPNGAQAYCNYIKKQLEPNDLRLDCNDFKPTNE